ncbi:MAG: NHLP bacteriocin export ABC transporter permease/ATPase subunit, partial [Flavobacteriaceae bacterium]
VMGDDIYFMLSLNDLQNAFYKKLVQKDTESKESELQRIQTKINTDTDKLHTALSQLGGIVNTMGTGKPSQSPFPGHSDNLLLGTCQLIGNEVGFSFAKPKFLDSYEESVKNQLFAIGQASKVRIRKVILRGTWWKEENGHILAFHKEGKTPVALIQKTPKSYLYKNLDSKEEMEVTQEVSESIDPVAYMFFFSFDRKLDSLKNVMQFAIQGIKKDARFLLLAALAGSLLGLLVPVLSGIMFDDVIPTADRSMLAEVFSIMLIIGVVTALLQLIQGVLQLRVETKSNVNLQGGLMDHLLRLPVSFYKSYTAGDLTNRVLSINAIRQILSNTVMTAALSGAFSVVNLGLLFYYESNLAWIGVGLAVLAVFIIGGIGWLKLKYDRDISDEQGEIQGFLFEFLSGITKIRITGAEKRIFALWAEKFSRMKRMAFRSGSYQNFIEVFNSSYPLFTNIFFFSFIYYTVTSASSPTESMISVGAFMAFISAFNQFLGDALKMSMSLITSLNVVSLYERVKPILEEVPESTEQSNDPGELMGGIELNSVSFRYTEEQPLVLNDVSLKINPGEMVAFIGPSGSGKSTIMRILLGFEEPEAGSVYYDGNAFESMNKDLVRRQIGVVLQNGSLMSGSIYKNIVGNSELNLDDAWEAARMAGMEEDIKQMPMEMHTMVSEGAGTFSGGQRQRLMIARAIVHKPRLLFMDEATSALDNKTQHIVSESLDNLQATRIVIAHRLSTIVNADRIYVLDKGSIVESGTYHELMQKNGLFTKLAKRQIA